MFDISSNLLYTNCLTCLDRGTVQSANVTYVWPWPLLSLQCHSVNFSSQMCSLSAVVHVGCFFKITSPLSIIGLVKCLSLFCRHQHEMAFKTKTPFGSASTLQCAYIVDENEWCKCAIQWQITSSFLAHLSLASF